ncbi:hypothetical protein AA21952_1950 [Acetobacter oeni LMG 21952]|nr:hypothetical protein AA21952_1950 [Acetobacter oeni LMG 21952]
MERARPIVGSKGARQVISAALRRVILPAISDAGSFGSAFASEATAPCLNTLVSGMLLFGRWEWPF